MATITTREYNPFTGAFIGNINWVSFGNISVGSTSQIKVIDFVFTGVTSVSNIKIGLMNSAGVTVNESPTGILSDGTASNGRFGIEHSSSFEAKTGLVRHFAGTNTSNLSTDPYNVTIETRDSVTSEYVYLDVEPGSSNTGRASGNWKVFFDFT